MVPIQTSFAAGELSPRLTSRVETKGYKEGVSILERMLPLAQGPAGRCSGFNFAHELTGHPSKARVVPFPITSDNYFVGIFYDQAVLMLNKYGEAISAEFVQNSEFTLGSTNWAPEVSGAAVVSFGILSVALISRGADYARIRQQLAGLVPGATYRFRVLQTSPLESIRLRVGTAPGGAQQAELISSDTSPVIQFTATAANHWIEVASLADGEVVLISNVSVQLNNPPAVPLITPLTEDVLSIMQFELWPAGGKMVIASGRYPLQELAFTAPGTFALAAAVITAPPADWAAGNYPRTVTFYGGRMWVGGTGTKPSTFWASKSGLFYNFTTGVLADDSLEYTIAKRGAIRWMVGAKSLLVGTDLGESTISATDGVITPTNINVDPQSAYGSSLAQPPMLGNVVLYPSADGRRVYSMGYRFEENGWISTDLAFAAEHITAGRIVAIAFAQARENILWMLDAEGKLLGVSYDRANNIAGWHRHPTPDMQFTSIGSVKFLGNDVLWAAWRMVKDGLSYLHVGFMPVPTGGVYLDSYKSVTLAANALVFPGYNHLIGKEVRPIVDGAPQPLKTVAADGTLTVTIAGRVCVAGLPQYPKLVTMPIEDNPQGVSTLGQMKHLNKVFIQLLSSGRPLVNGQRPGTRKPSTPMGTPEAPGTEKILITTPGWGLTKKIEITEPLPVELTISGIFGEMSGG